MHPLISAILLASASLVVAFDASKAPQHNAQERSPKQYTLLDHYSAEDFMNETLWSYFTKRDPTHGQTNYLSHEDAATAGLAYVQNGQAILAVDSKNDLPLGENRDSVRITTTKAYNGGLFIADFAAMAHGCAVWPAYWSVGSKWPNGGEIDIVEGVNLKPANQYTLHTGPGSGCVLKSSTTSGGAPYTGLMLGTQCDSSNGHDTGCAFLDPSNTSFGHNFNMAGGGIFAHLWDSSGLRLWYFVRDPIPKDIQNGQPDPSSWTTPVAFWSSVGLGCDFPSDLQNHHLVINTALGGGWASSDYPNSGCPGTYSDRIATAQNFVYAKWVINYISVYE